MAVEYAVLAGYQIAAGLQQAEMVRRQGQVQSQIDSFNAELADYDAWKVEAYGQTAVAQYQQAIDQAAGEARARAAAAGVDINSGSISEVVAENEMTGFLNKIDIENQAREKALGYKRQASNIRVGSQMNNLETQARASAVVGGSIAQAGSTVVQGISGYSIGKKKQAIAEKKSEFTLID